MLDIELLVPLDVHLIGLPVPLQNVVVPPTGSAWMTNSVIPVVL